MTNDRGPGPHPLARIDDLTIIIPVRDDRRLVACLDSVDVDCHTLVVLNSATPEFEAWARAACQSAHFLATPRAGLGHAYNLGLTACRTEYALLMDSDCVFMSGTIEKIRRQLDGAALSKGRVVFSHRRSMLSKAIAAYRTFHTADRVSAFSPPLALSRTAVKLLLNNYFNEKLPWSEDLDFDRRVTARGIRIAYAGDAVIVHPALSMAQDLRSAYRYGTGYAIGVREGVFPPVPPRQWWRRLCSDGRHFGAVKATKGMAAALYALVWIRAYRLGFSAELRR